MGTAAGVVERWLAELGPVPARTTGADHGCPHLAWAASGAMMLTGAAGGAPALAPGPVVPLLRTVDAALRELTGRFGQSAGITAEVALGARAGLRGMERRGATSTGGSSRFLRASDGWVAVTLARAEDREAVPAMFGGAVGADPWMELQYAAARDSAAEFVERVRLFGVPSAVVPRAVHRGVLPWRASRIADRADERRLHEAVVVDLSSLWAGPLCGQLLGRAGARVIKVESVRRPDGARAGEPRFYDWLHEGQESVALDFAHPEDRAELARLIESADIVIEASRPRALAQLGVAHHQLDLRPGVVWVSITGHGRGCPDLVAFGDDAAAAGGLVGRTLGGPVFCGDAIADPLTGVVAALGAVAARGSGGGLLLDVAMSRVAAAFAGAPLDCAGGHDVTLRRRSWFVTCASTGHEQRVLGPRVPDMRGAAPALGADNEHLLGMSAS